MLDETKACTLCEKQIPLSKYKLHDVMCNRLNYKCSNCCEIVSKKESHICEESKDVQESEQPPQQNEEEQKQDLSEQVDDGVREADLMIYN